MTGKGYYRISKAEWSRLGGLRNSDLFTKQTVRGVRTYYRAIR